MKIFMLALVGFVFSAPNFVKADLISIGCGENRGAASKDNPIEVAFDADDVTLGNQTWLLALSGKDVTAPTKAIFREDDKYWVYVVTTPASKKSGAPRQYVFKVLRGCQEEGDVGTVSIWSLEGGGRNRLATLSCVCSSD